MQADSGSRILGFDFARALAVLGMILVNFKIVIWNHLDGPGWVKDVLKIFEGKAAALFVVLAGIGVSLMVRRGLRENNTSLINEKRKILFKRSLFLFFAGLLYTTIWPADILHFYGIYIAAALLLLAVPSWRLLLFSGLVTGGWLILLFLLDYRTGWDFSTLTYLDLWTLKGMVRHFFFNGFHPVFPWLSFLLFGMWLGRQDLTEPGKWRKLLIWSTGILVLLQWGPSLLSLKSRGWTAMWLSTSPMPPMPWFVVTGCVFSVLVICFSLWLFDGLAHRRWKMVFVHTGQMALTLYIAHVIIGMGIIEEFYGLGKHSLGFTLSYTLIFWVLSMALAHIWRKRFKRGPVEWLMRKICG